MVLDASEWVVVELLLELVLCEEKEKLIKLPWKWNIMKEERTHTHTHPHTHTHRNTPTNQATKQQSPNKHPMGTNQNYQKTI